MLASTVFGYSYRKYYAYINYNPDTLYVSGVIIYLGILLPISGKILLAICPYLYYDVKWLTFGLIEVLDTSI